VNNIYTASGMKNSHTQISRYRTNNTTKHYIHNINIKIAK